MKKRGEITSSHIVGLITIILAFAIMAIFIWRFSFDERIDKETCHASVIYRGSISALAKDIAQGLVPLKCQTEKYCVSGGGGECDSLLGDVQEISVESKADIERFLAQSTVECWSMMGEGKISLFSPSVQSKLGLEQVYPTCVICSRIGFDKNDLNDEGISEFDLRNLDVLGYMKKYKLPQKDISYYQYLGGNTAPVSDKDIQLKVPKIYDKGKIELDDKGNIKYEAANLDDLEVRPVDLNVNEMAVVFMQISAPSHQDILKNTGIAAGGFVAAGVKIGGIKNTANVAKALFSKVGMALAVIGLTVQHYNVYKGRNVAAGVCGDLKTGGEERNGCSVVRLVDYDEEDISKYCSVIESIP